MNTGQQHAQMISCKTCNSASKTKTIYCNFTSLHAMHRHP